MNLRCISLLTLLFAYTSTIAQKGVYDILAAFNKPAHFEEHLGIHFSYGPCYEQNCDTTVTWEGNAYPLSLTTKDSTFMLGDTVCSYIYEKETMVAVNKRRYTTDRSKILYSSLKYRDESISFMNSEAIFSYDEQGRITQVVRNNQQNINITWDDNFLPKEVLFNMGINLRMNRKIKGDTVRYDIINEIPEDMKTMVKESLGENATEEEIIAALGPFGKPSNQYSLILPTAQGTFIESMYDIDDTGETLANGSVEFDTKYRVLHRMTSQFGNNTVQTYTYDSQGKMSSYSQDGEMFSFIYNDEGRITQGIEDGIIKYYEYLGHNLYKVTQVMGENLHGIDLYR